MMNAKVLSGVRFLCWKESKGMLTRRNRHLDVPMRREAQLQTFQLCVAGHSLSGASWRCITRAQAQALQALQTCQTL